MSNDLNKDTINDISEIITSKIEQVYNTSLTMANLRLLNNYKEDKQEWVKKQRNDLAVLKRDVANVVKKEIQPLFNTIETALIIAYAYSRKISDTKDLTKEQVQTIRQEIKERKDKEFSKNLARIQKQTAKTMNKIPNIIEKMQSRNISQVSYSLRKEPSIEEMYNGILKQTESGIENAPKIVYKDNRQVSFLSYADMKNRTELQHLTNQNQMEAGREAGLVFWLCSSFGDSAKDHVDYQGKIYVDRDWESIIEDEETRNKVAQYIFSNGILTKQDVEDGEPYLTTRPNCRHSWLAINTEEVIGGKDVNKMLKENDMIKNGAYEEKKAQARDSLRYQERKIREWKLKEQEKQIMLEKTPAGEEKDAIEKQLQRIKSYERIHQASARNIVKNNSTFLEREPVRENPRLIKTDLGINYEKKYYKN